MPLTLKCPKCAAKTAVPDNHAGPRISCSGCQVILLLPSRPSPERPALQALTAKPPEAPLEPIPLAFDTIPLAPDNDEPLLMPEPPPAPAAPKRRRPRPANNYSLVRSERRYTPSDLTAYDRPRRGLGYLMAAVLIAMAGTILLGFLGGVGTLALAQISRTSQTGPFAQPEDEMFPPVNRQSQMSRAEPKLPTTTDLLVLFGPAALSEALFIVGMILFAGLPERSGGNDSARFALILQALALFSVIGALVIVYLAANGIAFPSMSSLFIVLLIGAGVFTFIGLIVFSAALSAMGAAVDARVVGRSVATFWFALLLIVLVMVGANLFLASTRNPTVERVLLLIGISFGGPFLIQLFFLNMLHQGRAAINRFVARAEEALE